MYASAIAFTHLYTHITSIFRSLTLKTFPDIPSHDEYLWQRSLKSIHIASLSREICVNEQKTDGWTKSIMPPLSIGAGSIDMP